jgi:hypothetical protein
MDLNETNDLPRRPERATKVSSKISLPANHPGRIDAMVSRQVVLCHRLPPRWGSRYSEAQGQLAAARRALAADITADQFD